MKNTVNFTIEGVQGELQYTYGLFSRELRQDGNVVKQEGRLLPKYYIINASGKKEEIKIIQGIDFAVTVVFRGQKTRVTERLTAIEYIIGCLPIVLIFFGGAIGGMCGFIGAAVNYEYMRKEKNRMKQVGMSIFVSVVTYLVYFILALIVQSAIYG